MKQTFSRKDFITSAGKAGCAMLVAAGISSLVSSCGTIKVFPAETVEGKIRVPLSEFAESNMRLVRTRQLQYDVLVIKKPDNTFSALLMRCTHQDWGLSANAGGLSCSLHGSTFDLEGNITNGPATEPLKKFRVEQSNDQLIIS